MHAFCAPDLRKAVWPWLKDDQQYSNGDCDLLQLQVVCHSSPAQNPANTLLRGHCDLTQANGQTVQFRWWQTESLQHGRRQTTCNITDWDWVNQKKKKKALCDTPLQWGKKWSGLHMVWRVAITSCYLCWQHAPCPFCWQIRFRLSSQWEDQPMRRWCHFSVDKHIDMT